MIVNKLLCQDREIVGCVKVRERERKEMVIEKERRGVEDE